MIVWYINSFNVRAKILEYDLIRSYNDIVLLLVDTYDELARIFNEIDMLWVIQLNCRDSVGSQNFGLDNVFKSFEKRFTFIKLDAHESSDKLRVCHILKSLTLRQRDFHITKLAK